MADDNITGAEFGRWRADYQATQARMEERIDRGFTEINERLDVVNGRTRAAEQNIAVATTRLSKIETSGCGQMLQHQQVLSAVAVTPDARRPLHRDPVAYAGAGFGTLFATILYEFAKHLFPGLGL